MKKVLLSGVKPTGRPHIANYFGAMRQFVELQGTYDSFIMIANFHDLGTQSPKMLHENTLEVAIDHLAVGLDPSEMTLFVESDVPEHTELAWIFNGLTTVPYLQRAHAYKDAVAKGKEQLLTLFNYPVLMASDILMYQAELVPVGEDQRQHIEYAREIARKFNNVYGNTFKIPESLILKEVATVPGIDGQKMSKSYGNTIPLFASRAEIEKAVMSIPTDSQPPEVPKYPTKDIVFQLHTLFAGDALTEIRRGYEEGGLSYKESKSLLVEEIDTVIAPLRERREAIASDEDAVRTILRNGADRARDRARQTMHEVRKRVGLTY